MTRERVFHVAGMTCMGCANSVKRLLMALAGVEQVDVDLASGQVRVRFDPGLASEQALRDAIRDGGYEVAA